MFNFMWVLRSAFSVFRSWRDYSTWLMYAGTETKGNPSHMSSTKIYRDLKSTQIYTMWTDRVVRKYDLCRKAPSWNIFIMWEQAGTGGQDVVGNTVPTNTSNANTCGLSSSRFTIDQRGKQVGRVMGPQSWPLQGRKTGLFPDRQLWAQGKSLTLEGEDAHKKHTRCTRE